MLVPVIVIGCRPHPGAFGAVTGATAVNAHPSVVAPVAPLAPSTATRYVVPLVTAKVIVRSFAPLGWLLVGTGASDPMDAPVYAPSSVGKVLLLVAKVTLPAPGATQRYQMECAPPLPCDGSPGSCVE